MSEFWQIVKSWEPIGQGIFLLIVLGGIANFINVLTYYAVVAVRGWPPSKDVIQPADEDDP